LANGAAKGPESVELTAKSTRSRLLRQIDERLAQCGRRCDALRKIEAANGIA
jgi:hypothetical protein